VSTSHRFATAARLCSAVVRWVVACFVSLLSAGCEVEQITGAGQRVEVASSAQTGCRFLRTVQATEGANAQSPATNMDAVQASLRNQAARAGGDTVVITSQQLGWGSTWGLANGCANCISMVASVYRCGPDLEMRIVPANGEGRARVPLVAVSAIGKPPDGAAGFTFGADADAAEKRCTGAGHTWKALPDNRFSCSGAPIDIGFDAAIAVELRDGGVSAIAIDAVTEESSGQELVELFAKLKTWIASRYGSDYAQFTEPFNCTLDRGTCLVKGLLQTSATWTWQGGHSVELSLRGPAPGGGPALSVAYRTGKQWTPPKALVPTAASSAVAKDAAPAPAPSASMGPRRVVLERITPGARVILTRDAAGGKKIEKLIPEALWATPPLRLDVPAEERWTLIATLAGHDNFVRELTFPDGAAEVTIRIELAKKHARAP
jgi:hypothetical protein